MPALQTQTALRLTPNTPTTIVSVILPAAARASAWRSARSPGTTAPACASCLSGRPLPADRCGRRGAHSPILHDRRRGDSRAVMMAFAISNGSLSPAGSGLHEPSHTIASLPCGACRSGVSPIFRVADGAVDGHFLSAIPTPHPPARLVSVLTQHATVLARANTT
jgi:hypothetical protein